MNQEVDFNGTKYNIFYEEPVVLTRLTNELIIGNEYDRVFGKNIVVDIGANIGFFSILSYPYAKEIHAIEPYSLNYDSLIKTVADNNLDKIKTHKLALTSYTGEGFVDTRDNGMGGFFNGGSGKETVSCMTLPDFMDTNGLSHIDILKIDTEGSEHPILSATGMTERFPHIFKIIMEIHGDGDAIAGLLKSNGYEVESRGMQFYAYRT